MNWEQKGPVWLLSLLCFYGNAEPGNKICCYFFAFFGKSYLFTFEWDPDSLQLFICDYGFCEEEKLLAYIPILCRNGRLMYHAVLCSTVFSFWYNTALGWVELSKSTAKSPSQLEQIFGDKRFVLSTLGNLFWAVWYNCRSSSILPRSQIVNLGLECTISDHKMDLHAKR